MSWWRSECRHSPVSGYAGGAPYGRLSYQGTDGMSTVHVAVMVRCKHCGGEFEVARFHTNQAAMTAHEARGKPANVRGKLHP